MNAGLSVEELEASGYFARWGRIFARRHGRPEAVADFTRLARAAAALMPMPATGGDAEATERLFHAVRASVEAMHADRPVLSAVTVAAAAARERRGGIAPLPHIGLSWVAQPQAIPG